MSPFPPHDTIEAIVAQLRSELQRDDSFSDPGAITVRLTRDLAQEWVSAFDLANEWDLVEMRAEAKDKTVPPHGAPLEGDGELVL